MSTATKIVLATLGASALLAILAIGQNLFV